MQVPGDLLDRTLFELCAIPSPIGEEKELCDWVEKRMGTLPLASKIRRYNHSIVVPITRTGKPHVVLAGHLDTVRTENGPARIEGRRIFGSGASDMKSGLAVMIALVETLDWTKLHADLTLVFYAREEGPFAENELGPVLDQDPDLKKVDLAIALEPSDNKLHLGAIGSIHATITFEGRTSHSARPWEGESAITKAAPFLAEVGALAPEPHEIGGLVYRTVTSITQARDGGRGRNVVPDRFLVNLNHRFAPDSTLEREQKRITDLVAGRAKVEFTDLSPAAPPFSNNALVEKLKGSGVRDVQPKQAWTDVARFAALGIPAVNFGPGENAQAHQKNESTDMDLVHEGWGILARWLCTL